MVIFWQVRGLGKELSICRFGINCGKMRLFGVQTHTVWSDPVVLNSKPGTVVFGSIQLQSREVIATSIESGAVFKLLAWRPAALGLQLLRLCLPRIYSEP